MLTCYLTGLFITAILCYCQETFQHGDYGIQRAIDSLVAGILWPMFLVLTVLFTAYLFFTGTED